MWIFPVPSNLPSSANLTKHKHLLISRAKHMHARANTHTHTHTHTNTHTHTHAHTHTYACTRLTPTKGHLGQEHLVTRLQSSGIACRTLWLCCTFPQKTETFLSIMVVFCLPSTKLCLLLSFFFPIVWVV
jgi:ABC-type nickel/cobalt efflux system permease component RcnA